MAQRGWSQARLAHELGISQPHVSDLKRDQKDTGFTNAVQLLARVDWEVLIVAKDGREDASVKRREFNAMIARVAASGLASGVSGVALVPSDPVRPSKDPGYIHLLAIHIHELFLEQ